MNSKPVLTTLIVVLVSLGIGFAGGYFFRNYRLSKMRSNFNGQFQGRTGTMPRAGNGQGAQRGFGGMVTGEVISQDEKSITVKVADGSSRIVILGDSTTYSQTQTAPKSDLKVGDKVGVFGTANSDGSVTATSIQLNPTPTPK